MNVNKTFMTHLTNTPTVPKEKIILRMDSTQIVQYMKCSTLHNFVSVQNLTRKHEDRTSLDRGTIMHGLLERYYRKIWENETSINACNFALSQLNELKSKVNLTSEDYKLLTLRFIDYTIQYGKDKVKIHTGLDGKPAIEIGFSIPILDNEDYLFVLEGRIDLITEMSGQLVVWDHKYQGREYLLYGKSIQALNYRLACNARIFMFNYIRGHQKLQPNTFERKSDSLSKLQLLEWKEKLISIFYQKANNNRNAYSDFPNPTCADSGFGKRCPFTHVCEESNPNIKEAILKRDFMEKEKWEPWLLEE